jgi:hypothetical protein
MACHALSYRATTTHQYAKSKTPSHLNASSPSLGLISPTTTHQYAKSKTPSHVNASSPSLDLTGNRDGRRF